MYIYIYTCACIFISCVHSAYLQALVSHSPNELEVSAGGLANVGEPYQLSICPLAASVSAGGNEGGGEELHFQVTDIAVVAESLFLNPLMHQDDCFNIFCSFPASHI